MLRESRVRQAGEMMVQPFNVERIVEAGQDSDRPPGF